MKRHYRISYLSRLWRLKTAFLVVIALIAAVLAVVGVMAIWDFNLRSQIRARFPMPQIAARFHCTFDKESKTPLPVYELLISPADFTALKNPMVRIVDDPSVGRWNNTLYGVAQQKNFARVTVRFQSSDPATDNMGSARLRRRGYSQSAPSLPFSMKLVFNDDSVSGYTESHLLKMGWMTGKAIFWMPFHMWMADKLDLVTPNHRLVRVKVNGGDWGVFWEFEQWGKTTLERNNIADGEIYGESDEFLFVVEKYLWKNTESWKKYYPLTGEESVDLDFGNLHDLLDLLNNADTDTFNDRIFDYIDFDNVVRWTVHMAVMDSYHQSGYLNARLLFNKQSGKFEFIPWDAVPGLVSRLRGHMVRMYTSHVLLVRLFNNQRFFAAYTRRLYALLDEFTEDGGLSQRMEKVFSDLYLGDDLFCAMVENPYAGRLMIRKDVSARGLKSVLWGGPWKMNVEDMRDYFAQTVKMLKGILDSQLLFVSRNVSGGDGGAAKPLMILGHRGQSATVLNSLTLPLTTTALDGREVSAEIRLVARPAPPTLWLPYHPSNLGPRERTLSRSATVRNGRLVLEGLDLTLIPNFPKLQDSSLGLNPVAVHSQEYDLFVRLAGEVPVDYARATIEAENVANGRPLQPAYKNFNGAAPR